MSLDLIEGVDYYYNESGFVVFTESYHLNKGYCCGNGCKHCPYSYSAIPEPRRSEIIQIHRPENNHGTK